MDKGTPFTDRGWLDKVERVRCGGGELGIKCCLNIQTWLGLGTGDGVVIVINTFHRGGALSHFVIMFSLGWLLLGDRRGPGARCLMWWRIRIISQGVPGEELY